MYLTFLSQAFAATYNDGKDVAGKAAHPNQQHAFRERDHEIIMVPHCARHGQPPPAYDEFCRATQFVNPLSLITKEKMKAAWKAVMDCSVERVKMTREVADDAISEVSQFDSREFSIFMAPEVSVNFP